MKRTASLSSFLLLLSFMVFVTGDLARAEVESRQFTPIVLADCQNAAVVPCIEEVRVKTKDGRISKASLTGRLTPVDKEFVGPGYPEYSVPRLNFEGTSKNQFIPRIVYYPFPQDSDCQAKDTCTTERDFLALGVQPSWLNRPALNPTENELSLANRPSNLLCGSAEKREKCYRSNNFNIEIDFTFKLRMPKDFVPVWASGSARNVTLKDWKAANSATEGSYTLETTIGTLPREMVLFSDYYNNPINAIEASPYADYPADWPGIWIHSTRDRSVNPLGQCRNTPFMSVATNGIYQEVPVWNPVTESIDLKLYAPHLKVNGELNRGFYELRISEELARCFWKIDVSDKTQARVLISYPGANEDVVVETTKVSLRNGVLEVLATNFTFSSPTIRTQVFRSSVARDKESDSTLATPSQAKKKCVKGERVKKVPIKEKCPRGFKAKGQA